MNLKAQFTGPSKLFYSYQIQIGFYFEWRVNCLQNDAKIINSLVNVKG